VQATDERVVALRGPDTIEMALDAQRLVQRHDHRHERRRQTTMASRRHAALAVAV
jgi:hypothetical protein